MVICQVCGSTEFDLHEGLFYCQECHTQIKESRDERDDTECESTYSGYSVRTPEKEKSSEDEQPAPRPWVTNEAYNIILSKQVEALIDLGASPKLKNAVFYIWALYLQKCEVAFRKDYRASDGIPTLGLFPKKRDIKVVLGINNCRRSKRLLKQQKKRKKVEDSGEENVEDDLSMSIDQLSTDAETESDAVSDASQSQDSDYIRSALKAPKSIFSSYAKKAIRKYGKRKLLKFSHSKHATSPEYMTLQKTLCFCYLGLLYIKDQLLLCDLIRFVMEGRVPYMKTNPLLAQSLNLQHNDYTTFSGIKAPDMKKISVWAANIIEFLNLPIFKHPSLMSIAARFIKDLNFPDELVPMVKTLMDNIWKGGEFYTRKRTNAYFTIPLYEVKVAACIIMTLKMLFTLDGKIEKKHSKMVRKINAIQPDKQLFVWDDWEQAWRRMAPFLKSLNVICYSMSSVDLLDANSLVENVSTLAEPTKGSYLTKSKKNDQHMRSIMKNILDSVAPIKETFSTAPSSFPLRSQLGNLRINATSLHPYNETENLSFFSYEDFSLRSMAYIPDPEKINNAELEELYGELGSKCYELQDDVETVGETRVINSEYWHINCRWKKLSSTVKELPEVFLWLLNFVSKSIGSNSGDLYHEIIKVERDILKSQVKERSAAL